MGPFETHLRAVGAGSTGARAAKAEAQLSHARPADRVAPVRGDLGERRQHEVAVAEFSMGHNRPRPVPGAFRPEDDVEIEHAWAPAAGAAPAEIVLDPLERVE